MLTLFALSVMPKIVIHALVARHTDTHLDLHNSADQLNNASFHCTTDNLVVESPFLDYTVSIELGVSPSFPDHRPAPLESYHADSHFIFGLRGPPAGTTV